ncbi:hypothetical protein ACVFYP_07410 [Roseomonas sp. F4]
MASMIEQPLLAAVRAARHAALHRPDRFTVALDAIADQVDRLLDLSGEACAPLRHAGRRMAATLYRAQICAGERMQAISRLTEEALLVGRLERVLPCRDASSHAFPLARHGAAALPRHWLPQPTGGAAAHRAFTVVQGGRA